MNLKRYIGGLRGFRGIGIFGVFTDVVLLCQLLQLNQLAAIASEGAGVIFGEEMSVEMVEECLEQLKKLKIENTENQFMSVEIFASLAEGLLR